jgi:glycosyltransferase involved in cell wall biosynthesis
MACGVPAVAAASLGPAQIVDDGDTGWLFGVDDRAGLANALVDAVNRPSERARRSGLAEQAALERFTWPAIAHELADVLRNASGELLRLRRGVHAAPEPVRRASRRTLRGAGAGGAER